MMQKQATTIEKIPKTGGMPQAQVFSDHAERDVNHPEDPEDCWASPVAVIGSGRSARVAMTSACDSGVENTVDFPRVHHIDRMISVPVAMRHSSYRLSIMTEPSLSQL